MDKEFYYILMMSLLTIISGFFAGIFILGGTRTEILIFSFGMIFTVFFSVIFYLLYFILTKGLGVK